VFILRLWLAQEFIYAGWVKVSDGLNAPEWFAGLDFPFPVSLLPADLNWALAGFGELILGVALLLGIFSRLSAAGLMFIIWVAVYSVHFDLGWHGWNQIDTESGYGFKVPLMMAIMLLPVLVNGAGNWSVDNYLKHLSSLWLSVLTGIKSERTGSGKTLDYHS
tara:strand:+ start:5027 stop:5515 length:489 start_codon:yes stop_codon:yes gene_type:complete